jgi:hypothetical protein
MIGRKSLIFILGFAGMVVPGRATLTFYTSNAAFDSAVTGLSSPYGLETFVATYSGTDYTDASSGAEFEGFGNAGGSDPIDVSVPASTTVLQLSSGGEFLEITNIPANTYALQVSITTVSSFGFFCGQANVSSFSASNCENGSPSGTGQVEFMGVVSDTPITSFWIGPTSADGALQVDSFELYSTPEASTLTLMGVGLILLAMLRRRRIASAQS